MVLNFHTFPMHYPIIKIYISSVYIYLECITQGRHQPTTQWLFDSFPLSNQCAFLIYPQPRFIPMSTDTKYYAFNTLLRAHVGHRRGPWLYYGAPRTQKKGANRFSSVILEVYHSPNQQNRYIYTCSICVYPLRTIVKVLRTIVKVFAFFVHTCQLFYAYQSNWINNL